MGKLRVRFLVDYCGVVPSACSAISCVCVISAAGQLVLVCQLMPHSQHVSVVVPHLEVTTAIVPVGQVANALWAFRHSFPIHQVRIGDMNAADTGARIEILRRSPKSMIALPRLTTP